MLKFRLYFLVYFILLPCILLLSLCFGFAYTPLILLQLRHILWCFIVYFRIIFRDLTCAFLFRCSGFMHLLCTIIGHDISNIRHTLIVLHILFWIYLEGFQGQTCSHLCFLHCFFYVSL